MSKGVRHFLTKAIATVGGTGYSPIAPGTLGSLVGLGVAWVLSGDPRHQIIGCGVAIVLALWSAGPTARAMKDPDPRPVVIDEVAGMMAAAALLPVSARSYLVAFLLFRVLDIAKPPPLRQVQRLPGSWGILLDDLGAGLAAHLLTRLIIR